MTALLHIVSMVAMVAIVIVGIVEAKRYKSCSDGCCKDEFCAYNICYPKTDCRFGCPDGECIKNKLGEQICLPAPACSSNNDCDPGYACTPNYNLGYLSCQYQLCDGSDGAVAGNSLNDISNDKRSFLARWRGKAAFRPKGKNGPN